MKTVRMILAIIGASILLHAPAASAAPPTITKVTLSGLQLGAPNTFIVEGSELTADAKVFLATPIKSQSVKPDAKANRIEVEVTLDPAEVDPGYYLLRVVTDQGVSNALAISIDSLPQLPFAAQIASLPVALHGTLAGNQVLRTTFAGRRADRRRSRSETARRVGPPRSSGCSTNAARSLPLAKVLPSSRAMLASR